MFERWFRPSRARRFRAAKYDAWFRGMDRDRDGSITLDDLHDAADRLREHHGWPEDHPAHQHVRAAGEALWATIVGEADRSRDADVRRDEFAAFLGWATEEHGRTGELPESARLWVPRLFEMLDVDGSGRITEEEYGLFLQVMGAEGDAAAAFATLDLDGDGSIDLREVERLFEQWVISGEPGQPGNVLMTGREPA